MTTCRIRDLIVSFKYGRYGTETNSTVVVMGVTQRIRHKFYCLSFYCTPFTSVVTVPTVVAPPRYSKNPPPRTHRNGLSDPATSERKSENKQGEKLRRAKFSSPLSTRNSYLVHVSEPRTKLRYHALQRNT